jgi:hypothetical protein
MYNIHFTAFIRQLLPPPIRKEPLISICEVLFRPMKSLFTAFAAYRREATLEITATGQVAVLEYNLSRLAGLPVNYIYITGSSNADFAVLVPDFMTSKQVEEIRLYVAAHKLLGKSFEIVINV